MSGWESFDPWLPAIEKLDPKTIRSTGEDIPLEWCDDWEALKLLIDTIIQRRAKVRDLIAAFRDSSRNPFPGWRQESGNARKSNLLTMGAPGDRVI